MRDNMKRAKKTKLNYKRIAIVIVVLLLFALAIFFGMKMLGSSKKVEPEPVKVVDSLESYGYTLDENETSYYKSLFQELKTVLNEEEVDEEAYAKLIVQLFCADFFNLDNKLSNNDIGGTQFVYESYRNDFLKYAREGIYHHVESNLYGERDQELPQVTNVEIINIESKPHDYLEETDENAYAIDVEITYKENLGYQETATFYLVHTNDKLEIVELEQ